MFSQAVADGTVEGHDQRSPEGNRKTEHEIEPHVRRHRLCRKAGGLRHVNVGNLPLGQFLVRTSLIAVFVGFAVFRFEQLDLPIDIGDGHFILIQSSQFRVNVGMLRLGGGDFLAELENR